MLLVGVSFLDWGRGHHCVAPACQTHQNGSVGLRFYQIHVDVDTGISTEWVYRIFRKDFTIATLTKNIRTFLWRRKPRIVLFTTALSDTGYEKQW